MRSAVHPSEAEGAAPLIVDRLGALRDASRLRRLRVQGVPFALGAVCGLAGVVIFLHERLRYGFSRRSHLLFGGLALAHLGPFAAALAIRLQDTQLLRALVSILGGIYCNVGLACALAFVEDQRFEGDALRKLLLACLEGLGVCAGTIGICMSALTVYADVRLGAPTRVSYRRMWLTAGCVNVVVACAYVFAVVVAGAFPAQDGMQRHHVPTLCVLTVVAISLCRLSFWPRLQERVHAWLSQIGEPVTVAAGISELLCGRSPEEVVASAREHFHAVPVDRLCRHHFDPAEIGARLAPPVGVRAGCDDDESSRAASSSLAASPVGPAAVQARTGGYPARATWRVHVGSSLVRKGALDPTSKGPAMDERFALPAVCERANLGKVDAFVSHSWHDDAELKWEALQAWRCDFVAEHGREPTVWFDRLCIVQDPELISMQLANLPVYLAGCQTLLVLRGKTYMSRLWCVLELFIFSEMGAGRDQIRVITLPDADELDAQPRSSRAVRQAPRHSAAMDVLKRLSWAAPSVGLFDVRNATTTDPRDKSTLLAVIENAGAGVDTFNDWARAMLAKGF